MVVAEELEGVFGKYFDGFKEKVLVFEVEDEEVVRRFWVESVYLVGLEMFYGFFVKG